MTDNNEQYVLDQYARDRIVSATDTNLFVEASAGSGKTTKLVDRMVAMVGNGVDIRKICAITFTINAAREFYRRFRNELSKKVSDPEAPEGKLVLYKDALENIDLCFMGTIDSFCQTILSEHPMEAGIPSGTIVTSEKDMLLLYRRELSAAANGGYGKEMQALYRRAAGAVFHADTEILDVLKIFADARDTVHMYLPVPDESIDQMFKDEKREILDVLGRIDGHPELLNLDNAAARKACDYITKGRFVLAKDWGSNIAAVKKALGNLKGLRLACPPEKLGLNDSSLFTPHVGRGSWNDCTIGEPGHILESIEEIQYSMLVEFIDRFSREAAARLESEGYLNFYGYQYRLLELLKKDIREGGKLIEHISGRHSYYLLDEFQDTDPIQAEIFFYLAAEHPVEDWRRCTPRPGSLFIVGDPKQSIYRFRSADISSYIDVKGLFVPPVGETLHMFRNFRSTPGMCRAFNELYSSILPVEDTEYQSSFDPIPVTDVPDTCGCTEGVFSYTADTDAEKNALKTVEIINRLVGNPEILIYDSKKKKERSVDYSDIMVITHSKKALDVYMRTCIDDGIPVYVEGKTVFSECPAIHRISAVFGGTAYPEDSLKVYNALTCGIFGVDDRMLSEFCLSGRKVRLRVPDEDTEAAFPEICRAVNLLMPLVRLAKNGSPAAVFSGIVNTLPVLETAGTAHLDYVYYALELIKSGELDGSISTAADAAAFLDSLASGDAEIERSMNLSGEADCVHFANLHKVKGLEAPVVILADPYQGRAPKKPSHRTERDGSLRRSYHFSLRDAKFNDFAKTAEYDEKLDAEVRNAEAEKLRLLYVAGTRAGNILIVPNLGDKQDKNVWKAFYPLAKCEMQDVTGAFAPVRESNNPEEMSAVIEDGLSNCIFTGKSVADPSFSIMRPSKIRVKSRSEEPDKAEDKGESGTDQKAAGRADAALVGTMVHRLMEMLVSSRNTADTDAVCSMVLSEYSFSADKAEEYRTLLSNVARKMRSGGFVQANGTPADILNEAVTADEVYCELPYCLRDGQEIYHGYMDLVYCRNGGWHIVDYKTNADPDDLDSRYLAQLSAYEDAFLKLTGNTATAGTYHIDV